jgi:hypothetical protein
MYLSVIDIVLIGLLIGWLLCSQVLHGRWEEVNLKVIVWILRWLIVIAGMIVLFYRGYESLPSAPPTTDTAGQISRLDSIQSNLASIQQFLDAQRAHALGVQAAIEKLNAERAVLAPVVESEQRQVEAILSVYDERSKHKRWFELSASFVIGVISSLIASFVRRKLSGSRY